MKLLPFAALVLRQPLFCELGGRGIAKRWPRAGGLGLRYAQPPATRRIGFAGVLGLVCLALAGCRTDPQIELLERELRLQEDEIYRLKDCIEDYQSALDVQQGSVLPERSGAGQAAAGVPTTAPSPADSAPLTPPVPQLGEPVKEGELPGLLKEFEVPQAPTFQPGQPDHVPSDAVPPDNYESRDAVEGHQTSAAEPISVADSRQVAQLVLSRLRTGGHDMDGRPGDEGITVVIEPRDAQGRTVMAPADVSVVAVDPALQGEAARVARWDFSAAETVNMFRTGARDIRLQMLWPADPPVHGKLHLFVRYTTSDGRRLQADQPIEVNLPGEHLAGWVPSKQPAAPQVSPPAESRQLRSSPEIRLPASPSPRTAVRPAEPVSAPPPATPKLQPPVWSPDRR